MLQNAIVETPQCANKVVSQVNRLLHYIAKCDFPKTQQFVKLWWYIDCVNVSRWSEPPDQHRPTYPASTKNTIGNHNWNLAGRFTGHFLIGGVIAGAQGDVHAQ